MCTALDDDNGFLSFSDTSSREHCVKNEHNCISDLIGYKPQLNELYFYRGFLCKLQVLCR